MEGSRIDGKMGGGSKEGGKSFQKASFVGDRDRISTVKVAAYRPQPWSLHFCQLWGCFKPWLLRGTGASSRAKPTGNPPAGFIVGQQAEDGCVPGCRHVSGARLEVEWEDP